MVWAWRVVHNSRFFHAAYGWVIPTIWGISKNFENLWTNWASLMLVFAEGEIVSAQRASITGVVTMAQLSKAEEKDARIAALEAEVASLKDAQEGQLKLEIFHGSNGNVISISGICRPWCKQPKGLRMLYSGVDRSTLADDSVAAKILAKCDECEEMDSRGIQGKPFPKSKAEKDRLAALVAAKEASAGKEK